MCIRDSHSPGPVGAEVGQVARLAEVHLDGHVLAVHIDIAEAGGHHQPGQLLGQVLPPVSYTHLDVYKRQAGDG